jgi:hypothetical protein
MTAFQPAIPPAELTVIAYPDTTVEALGYGPDHPYIEGAIASVVGPSATLLWKRLARLVIKAAGVPVTVDTIDLLACVGLGPGLAKNSIGARTVARMAAFDMARRAGRDGNLLAVRTALAPLNAARASRLPASARREHDHITANRTAAVRFALGKLHVTPGAIAALARTGTDPATLLDRHQHGDWGHVDTDEALANNNAMNSGALLHSIYDLDPAAELTVWVLTEGDRRAATITTPDEY